MIMHFCRSVIMMPVDEVSSQTKAQMPKIVLISASGANLFSLINYGIPMLVLGWQVFQGITTIGEFQRA